MRFRRVFMSALFLALTVSVANAYTIVMRDGRRVEIPNEFTVTNSTITYPAGSGIQITIQLNTVDIAATERANGQPKGALLQRSFVPAIRSSVSQRSRPTTARSITNADLEGYRRARVQSERAYELRRKELGLPSPEERRREVAEIEDRTRQQLREMRAEEQNSEQYWRERASALRAEIAATEAQINYVRRRLGEIPSVYSFGAFSTTIPFGTVGAPITTFPFQSGLTPNVFAPSIVTGVGQGFGGRVFRPVFQSPLSNGPGRTMLPGTMRPGGFPRFNGGARFGAFPFGNVLALPFQSYGYDYSLERSELVSQLNALEMQNAGLKARWRDLEDEARRAGAYPGWLRP